MPGRPGPRVADSPLGAGGQVPQITPVAAKAGGTLARATAIPIARMESALFHILTPSDDYEGWSDADQRLPPRQVRLLGTVPVWSDDSLHGVHRWSAVKARSLRRGADDLAEGGESLFVRPHIHDREPVFGSITHVR